MRETSATTDELLTLLRRIADGVEELRRFARTAATNGAVARTALSVAETAELLCCSRTRVFGLLRTGTLKRAPRSGRATLVTQESIQEALSSPAPTPRARRHRRSERSAWKPIDRRKLGV